MRKYQLWLKGMNKLIEISAEDVKMHASSASSPLTYLFIISSEADDKDYITVAVVTFDNVEYITSSPA
jgi:hypothetical protein